MATYISNKPSFGQLLGTGLGKGLGSGLEALANQKLQQIQQRNLGTQLQQLLPGQEQKAGALAALPEKLQQVGLKELLAQPGRQAYAQALGGVQGEQQGQIPTQLTEQQATNIVKMNQKERQVQTAEQKETRKYLEPFEAAHAKGREIIQQNKELKQLALSGDLRAGPAQAILDSLGLGNYWRPLSNELAQKNLANQAQNAGAAFNTSRLTNLDVKLYEKSLGTLWNTPQGIFAIASVNNLKQKAKDAVHKARRTIVNENKGRVPFNIEELAEEKAQPELAKYAAKSMEIVTNAAAKYSKSQAKKAGGFETLDEARKSGLQVGDTITDNDTGAVYEWNGSSLTKKG